MTQPAKKPYPYQYDLYYVPELAFEDIDLTTLVFDKLREQFREDIQAHIAKHGLQSPIYLNRKNGSLRVRRGNNRITALKNLGRDSCPAFIVDYDRVSVSDSWERLDYDKAALQSRFFSKGNCILQLSYNRASVVTPHVPSHERLTQYTI